MFEQALLESAKHMPGTRRTCSTAASLLLQSAALATFIIVPILSTQVAPRLQRQQPIFIPQPSTPAPHVETSGMQSGSTSFSSTETLHQPRSIQALNPNRPEPDTPPASLHGSGPDNAHPGFLGLFTGSGSKVVLAEQAHNPPTSVLEAGVVLSRVQPLYPHIAIVNRIQGMVHLKAVITSGGTLEELRVLSGQPILAQAAADAVRQWKFRPYVLNGKPIEVQTEVIVNFSLN